MTTASLSFNARPFGALYCTTLRRALPVGILYGVAMFFAFPVLYLSSRTLVQRDPNIYVGWMSFSGTHTAVSAVALTLLCSVVPIILAAVCFHHLFDRRSSDVFHALPIRREWQFSANYLAGITLLWTPLVLCHLVVLIAAAVMRPSSSEHNPTYFLPGPILQELLGWMLVTAAVFTVACLLASLAGTALDTILYTLALCGMWAVIAFLVNMSFSVYLVGYTDDYSPLLRSAVGIVTLSPFTMMLYRISMGPAARSAIEQMEKDPAFAIHTWGLVAWCVLTVALVALAIHFYRRRPSERAGRAFAAAIPGRIVQFGTAFAVGLFLAQLVGIENLQSNASCLLWCVAGSAFAFALLELIFARGFRSFPRAFLPMGVAVLLPTALLSILFTGGLGFEQRIPEVQDIASVTIHTHGRFDGVSINEGDAWSSSKIEVAITDPDGIALLRQAHLASIQDQKQILEMRRDTTSAMLREQNDPTRQRQEARQEANSGLTITYQLKNGGTLTRRYYQIWRETLEPLEAIENLEEFKRQTHPAFILDEQSLTGVTVFNPLGLNEAYHLLTNSEKTALLEALRQDTLAETVEELRHPAAPALGYVELLTSHSNALPVGTRQPGSAQILLTAHHTNTLAVLRTLKLDTALEVDVNSIQSAYLDFANPHNFHSVPFDRYAYITPATRYRGYEDGMLLNQQDAQSLFALAQSTTTYDVAGIWQLTFQIEGKQMCLPLMLPEDKIPASILERYRQYENSPIQ